MSITDKRKYRIEVIDSCQKEAKRLRLAILEQKDIRLKPAMYETLIALESLIEAEKERLRYDEDNE